MTVGHKRTRSEESEDRASQIDALYYPHIIDVILDYGSRDNAEVLSQVCRDWKYRVHRRLRSHVLISEVEIEGRFWGDNGWELTTARPPHLFVTMSSVPLQRSIDTGRDPLEHLTAERREGIHAVDVRALLDTDYHYLKFIDALPNLHTVRLAAGSLLRNVGRLSHIERIVVSDPIDLPQGSGPSPAPCRRMDCKRQHTKRLVINLTKPALQLYPSGALFGRLQPEEVVIILHPWTEPPCFLALDPQAIAVVIAAHALSTGSHVTVVNPEHIDLCTGAYISHFSPNLKGAAMEFANLLWEEARRRHGSVESWIGRLHFCTAGGYAAAVGSDEFELESMLDW